MVPINIALIGFMGSGKTTVGRLLAVRLGMKFIDLDDVIKDKLGMEITEIFSNYGEKYFRDVESQVVKEVFTGVDNSVIACGGGVVLRDDNVRIINQNSVVVYLRISPYEAYSRLLSCRDRPLLNVSNRLEVINQLMRVREPLYLRTAHIVVDVDGRTPEDIVEEIIRTLSNKVV